MEVKFIKFLKTTNQLFLSVLGESICFTVDYSEGVPYVKPHTGSKSGLEVATRYLMDKIDVSIFDPAKEGTKYVPVSIGMFHRLLGQGGQMNSGRWRSVVDFDMAEDRLHRRPSAAVSYNHFVHRGAILDSDRHFVVVTTNKFFLMLDDNWRIYARVGIDVPPPSDIANYMRSALAYLNHIRDGRKGLCDMVNSEAANTSIDMSTGYVEFLSGGSQSQDEWLAGEVRKAAVEICNHFGLTVPPALFGVEGEPERVEVMTIERLFELGDTVQKFLPGEAIRCEEAMKFGDYYYLIHGMELSAGEQDGVLVRLETVRYGSSKNSVTYSPSSPVAVLFDRYAVTRSVRPSITITDFTGMDQKEFTKYLQGKCR